MNRDWIWTDEGWSDFTEFAGDLGEAFIDPLQAYVPGVDAAIDLAEYIENTNPENLADIFVPEELEGVVGVIGDYGPGGENNEGIWPDDGIPNLNGGGGDPDPPPPNDPVNTPIPMDNDLDEDPMEDDPSWAVPEEPTEGPPTNVFDDAWENENEEDEIDFATPPVVPPVTPPVVPPVVSSTSHCCCCCCCPCQCCS